jgi:hypothetical protein
MTRSRPAFWELRRTTTVWGQITSVSPLAVQVRGDTVATPVAFKSKSLPPLVIGDKVRLIKSGTKWYLVDVIVSS